MSSFNRRGSTLSIAFLALLVLGLAAGVVHQRLAASRTRQEIAEQKRLLARYKSESCKCAISQREYKAFCMTLGGRLPECSWSDQMPFMLSQVEGIMTPRGLKIETLQPQPMLTYTDILRFPIRIGLQADLAALIGLLEDFEKTHPLLEVDRLDVRNAQGQGDKLQVDITLSSFVVIDPTSPVVKRRVIRPANAAPEALANSTGPQADSTGAQIQPAVGKASPPAPTSIMRRVIRPVPKRIVLPSMPHQPIRVPNGGPK